MNRALMVVAGASLCGCAMSQAAFGQLSVEVSADNDRAYEAATVALLTRHQATRIDEAEFTQWVNLPEATRRRCLVLAYGAMRKGEVAADREERVPLVRQSCDHMPRVDLNPFEHDLGPVRAWWVPDEPLPLLEASADQTGLEARCTDNTY